MKKLLSIALLVVLMALPIAAQSQVAVVPPPPVCGGAGVPVCPVGSIILPAVAVAFAMFVIYADAEGINFPLCRVGGLKCSYSYPNDRQ